MTVAPLIRESRRLAGLSQQALAALARTSQPAVARYESGEIVPRSDTLERLLAACGRTIAAEQTRLQGRPLLGPIGYQLTRNREAVLAAARRAGASNVRVFGSVARAQDTAGSDVDLLVDLDPGRTLLDVVGLTKTLSELLGVRVDVAIEEILKPEVRERAIAEARAL